MRNTESSKSDDGSTHLSLNTTHIKFSNHIDTIDRKTIVDVDWCYFGPPVPQPNKTLKISPYWPASASWNIREAKQQLLELMMGSTDRKSANIRREKYANNHWWSAIMSSASGITKSGIYYDLREIVALGGMGGIPTKLSCICDDDNCMLELFDHICKCENIVRIPCGAQKLKVSADDVKWLILVPKIRNSAHMNALIQETGLTVIQSINYWYCTLDDIAAITSNARDQWMVGNIDTLAYAVGIPKSPMCQRLIATCKKYATSR
jgi:hypothetical protein